MYSTSQRVNGIFAFGTTVIFVLLAAIAGTTFLYDRTVVNHSMKPAVDVKALSVIMGRHHYDGNTEQEFAFVKFDIDVGEITDRSTLLKETNITDFKPLFNWNTKQLFAYVVAEYTTDKFTRNQVVLYDKIIRTKKFAHLRTKSNKNKYAFPEITRSFKDINATFTLHWDTMPYVGLLTGGVVQDERGFKVHSFPATKQSLEL